MIKFITIILFTGLVILSCREEKNLNYFDISNLKFSYQEINGLEKSPNITRRDPSDIIELKGKYYFWYTKTEKGRSGYNATIWYAVSEDSYNWTEKGEALGRGKKGTWDEYSVFTPNILIAENKFYLFYTAVKRTSNRNDFYFENNSTDDFTAIGLSVADSPDDKFTRVENNPVLTVSKDSSAFDSYRVDDACVIVRQGKYWLYYKGRSNIYGNSGPMNTKMGVAFASNPEGPYVKYDGNPVTKSGHEVMVWSHNEGVMTLISAVGENGKTIQFADNGFNFQVISKLGDNYPKAPGYFRKDNFMEKNQVGIQNFWGISMSHGNDENMPFLLRYEFESVKSYSENH